jgi:hypothetical protein
VDTFTLGFIAYACAGIAIYFALYRLFRKAGFSISALNDCWHFELLIVWPIPALLSLMQYGHLTHLRRRKKERETLVNSRDKYSSMTMDELLAAQRKVLESFGGPKK